MAGERSVATGTATLVPDDDGRRGWTLYVNGMESSHVDLDDPTRLDFEYMRWLVSAILAAIDRDSTPRVLHLGGGGCTLPRTLAAAYPGARQVVVELDPGVLQLAMEAFGLRSGPRLRLRTGDARAAVSDAADGAFDLVVRDAFAGSQVPPHLITHQFATEVRRVLTRGGLYLANLADGAGLQEARREAAALLTTFAHVALVAEPGHLHGRRYGNVLLAGSDAELPLSGWGRRLAADPVRARLLDTDEVRRFASGRRAPDDAQLTEPWTIGTGSPGS